MDYSYFINSHKGLRKFSADEVSLSLKTGPHLTRPKKLEDFACFDRSDNGKNNQQAKDLNSIAVNSERKAVTMKTFKKTIGIATCVGILATSATSVFATGDIFTIGDASDAPLSSSLLVQPVAVQLPIVAPNVIVPELSTAGVFDEAIAAPITIGFSADGAGVAAGAGNLSGVTGVTPMIQTPEPGTMLLGGLGGGLLWFLRSRRQTQAQLTPVDGIFLKSP